MKSTASRITWPDRPRRLTHRILGRRLRWLSSDARLYVDRFTSGTRLYHACLGMRRADGSEFISLTISQHRTLRAAQAACERNAWRLSPATSPTQQKGGSLRPCNSSTGKPPVGEIRASRKRSGRVTSP